MDKINLGVNFLAYQSREYFDEVWASWIKLKENPSLCPLLGDLKISAVHTIFPEVAALGWPILSTDGTVEYLEDLHKNKIIDYFDLFHCPLEEQKAWTLNVETLNNHDLDYYIMVNGDEVITIEDLNKILSFIQRNEFIDIFHLHYRNYCIDFDTWYNGFLTPRIWKVKTNEGLAGHWRDDLVFYKNSKKNNEVANLIIPDLICRPKHLSWVSKDPNRMKMKVEFQAQRYGECSFKWNYEQNKLEINYDYYRRYNKLAPELFKD